MNEHEKQIEQKDREIAALKLKLAKSEAFAREATKQARALASLIQHHLCLLDGTARRETE